MSDIEETAFFMMGVLGIAAVLAMVGFAIAVL